MQTLSKLTPAESVALGFSPVDRWLDPMHCVGTGLSDMTIWHRCYCGKSGCKWLSLKAALLCEELAVSQ